MATSAGSIALALEGRAAMVTASAVRTYGLTPLPRRSSGANASGASRLHSPEINIGNGEKEGSCPRAWVGASRCRAFDSGLCSTPHPSNSMARAPGGTRRALREGVCSEGRARRGCRSGASLLGSAFEQGAAGGAEVATVMGHARPDTIDVRDVLLAEPHRIRFAGRALLRRPLLRGGWRRRERQREAQERGRERGRERGSGHHRPELRLCDTYFHYRPSSWCSVPVSTVNPTSMASSAAGDGDPARIVKANLNGSVVRSIW